MGLFHIFLVLFCSFLPLVMLGILRCFLSTVVFDWYILCCFCQCLLFSYNFMDSLLIFMCFGTLLLETSFCNAKVLNLRLIFWYFHSMNLLLYYHFRIVFIYVYVIYVLFFVFIIEFLVFLLLNYNDNYQLFLLLLVLLIIINSSFIINKNIIISYLYIFYKIIYTTIAW